MLVKAIKLDIPMTKIKKNCIEETCKFNYRFESGLFLIPTVSLMLAAVAAFR